MILVHERTSFPQKIQLPRHKKYISFKYAFFFAPERHVAHPIAELFRLQTFSLPTVDNDSQLEPTRFDPNSSAEAIPIRTLDSLLQLNLPDEATPTANNPQGKPSNSLPATPNSVQCTGTSDLSTTENYMQNNATKLMEKLSVAENEIQTLRQSLEHARLHNASPPGMLAFGVHVTLCNFHKCSATTFGEPSFLFTLH
jgi:hypothetical protein